MTGMLSGRSVLVTGAGAGLGRGIALACAAEGADVVIASRHENGAATAAEIEQRGGVATWAPTDVTDRAQVDRAVAVAVARSGGLDAMVHNATSGRSSEPHRLEDVDAQLWDEHAAVSLRGSYLCARAALPSLQARAGTMILMTSPAGMEGSVGLPIYGTVKGALRGFTKSLAREWAPLGVTVNIVSPLSQSPAMTKAIREDPALGERLARRVPLGRVGDPETDVAPAIAFLASGGARYITGQTLVVDGGRFMNL